MLHPRLTAAREKWLRHLLNGPDKRARGKAGFECMMLGWTDWLYRLPDGRKLSGAELQAIGGHPENPGATNIGEVISDAGRAMVLAQPPGASDTKESE